jgi:uncharacterized membrane protein HdeD (DUF308 family)
MIESLTRNWWIQLIRGALAFALGMTALIAPSTSTTVAAFLVAAFAIGDGAMTITAGMGIREDARARGALVGAGAGFIVLGLIVLFWAGIPTTALVLLFAAWLIVSGGLVAYGAQTLRAQLPKPAAMTALGAVIAAAGLILAAAGPAAISNVLPFAGWFGLIVGATLAAVSLRLRSDAEQLPQQALAA